jgi:alpha-tubulin suppressor-like RCC1 family protein
MGVDQRGNEVEFVGAYSCGIRADGSLWCWGLHSSGQLGEGAKKIRPAPVRIGAPATWDTVSTGTDPIRGI